MGKIAIALDLGTSGIRGQAIDLERGGAILSTAITPRHPLPGANVIDHLHFALEVGLDHAHDILIHAVNRVIGHLGIDNAHIVRLAVCGNPIQVSLFEAIEIRDLAYAGKRKLDALGVIPPKRDAKILKAREVRGLEIPADADVLVPPAVRHEIGADALAMMIQTDLLSLKQTAMVTDYGTNNEMALLVDGVVYTGSTAAGPALEGQHIEDGLLALPGAICDLEFEPEANTTSVAGYRSVTLQSQAARGHFKTFVLNKVMKPQPGDAIDPASGEVVARGELEAVGITGTGVVALINEGIKARLIKIPKINTSDHRLQLPDGVQFSEKDLLEAGKAIGAVRAGHITLCREAGIRVDEIEIAFCSGASGTYVDARKAQQIGMIPPGAKKIYQVGNTSLAMARDIVVDESKLWHMKKVANDLRQHHCMFAESKVFEKIYILELSHWTEGMPLSQYRKLLEKYGLPTLADPIADPEVIKTVERDIQDLGQAGLTVIADIGERRSAVFEGCVGDMACIYECPENALQALEQDGGAFAFTIDLSLCNGVACRRCERACREKTFNLIQLIAGRGKERGPSPGEAVSDTMAAFEERLIPAMLSVKGIVRVARVAQVDRHTILLQEEEAEKRSLMGLGKVINAGVRAVLKADAVYVALTDMTFDWGCQATLVLKKDGVIVGEEVRDAAAIAALSTQKNVWFMHRNFVIYKEKISFPRDIVQKKCQFEIPSLPADWCVVPTDAWSPRAGELIYSTPSTLCDTYLKERYFDNRDERGLGTILLGVHFPSAPDAPGSLVDGDGI
jgi:methylamine methyltransferase corrinoid protein reductive activase